MNTIGATKEEKNKEIVKKKMAINFEDLCKGLPKEFLQYFTFVKKLAFAE